ncbi:hypothetical protein [Litchfieldella rifensis]|uniref:Uncharacterized protein n=1 Tax=Litchfieldella rifensis TaxID=762643 RepID=A0ABV7LQM8_9GAMM
MPHDQTDVAKLVLLPEELLVLANAHERQEMNHYRRLAFGFLPFDLGMSKLMAALGIECERRLDEQRQASQRLALPDTLTAHETRHAKQYFFVVNRDMAMETLTQAIAVADYSLRFSEHLLDANATPELDPMLTAFVKQKRAECRILQDSLDACVDRGPKHVMAGYGRQSAG